jgi:hypothetical protein
MTPRRRTLKQVIRKNGVPPDRLDCDAPEALAARPGRSARRDGRLELWRRNPTCERCARLALNAIVFDLAWHSLVASSAKEGAFEAGGCSASAPTA